MKIDYGRFGRRRLLAIPLSEYRTSSFAVGVTHFEVGQTTTRNWEGRTAANPQHSPPTWPRRSLGANAARPAAQSNA